MTSPTPPWLRACISFTLITRRRPFQKAGIVTAVSRSEGSLGHAIKMKNGGNSRVYGINSLTVTYAGKIPEGQIRALMQKWCIISHTYFGVGINGNNEMPCRVLETMGSRVEPLSQLYHGAMITLLSMIHELLFRSEGLEDYVVWCTTR